RLRTLATGPDRFTRALVLSWFAGTFVLPSVVATKLGWYLNSFYPLFALAVAWTLVAAWQSTAVRPWRAAFVAASFVAALGVAEAKLAWHSYRLLDLDRSAQSLVLAHGTEIENRQVYATTWPHSDRFVVRTVGGRCVIAPSVDAFLASSQPDDLWLGTPDAD